MKKFKVAVAQIPSIKGNINLNITAHLNAIYKAGTKDVSLLVFPELSLTGYEPELAKSLAFTPNDLRLTELIQAAKNYKMHIIVGAPLKTESLPQIGAIIISPEGKVLTYSKMNLHPGEEEFFSAGTSHLILEVEDKKVAIAICADTGNSEHAKYYGNKGADIYVAGVLITEGGYALDTSRLESYAKNYKMLVAMANHNKPTGGWSPIGKSAIWNSDGLLTSAAEIKDSLVIAENISNNWISEIIEL